MTLDQWLTEQKKASGLTEADFASRIGISQPHVNRLRKGAWPPKGLMERIRAATDGEVTADDFLPPHEPPQALAERTA